MPGWCAANSETVSVSRTHRFIARLCDSQRIHLGLLLVHFPTALINTFPKRLVLGIVGVDPASGEQCERVSFCSLALHEIGKFFGGQLRKFWRCDFGRHGSTFKFPG